MLDLELIKKRVTDYFNAHEFISDTYHEPVVISQEMKDLVALIAEIERLRGLLEDHRMTDRLQTTEFDDA